MPLRFKCNFPHIIISLRISISPQARIWLLRSFRSFRDHQTWDNSHTHGDSRPDIHSVQQFPCQQVSVMAIVKGTLQSHVVHALWWYITTLYTPLLWSAPFLCERTLLGYMILKAWLIINSPQFWFIGWLWIICDNILFVPPVSKHCTWHLWCTQKMFDEWISMCETTQAGSEGTF